MDPFSFVDTGVSPGLAISYNEDAFQKLHNQLGILTPLYCRRISSSDVIILPIIDVIYNWWPVNLRVYLRI